MSIVSHCPSLFRRCCQAYHPYLYVTEWPEPTTRPQICHFFPFLKDTVHPGAQSEQEALRFPQFMSINKTRTSWDVGTIKSAIVSYVDLCLFALSWVECVI